MDIAAFKDFSSMNYGNVTDRACYRCFVPAASKNGLKKWPVWKVGKAISVLEFGNEGTMDDILKAFQTRR